MDMLSAPSFYLSAPTSPGVCSPQDLRFYSTSSSPLQQKTDDDEFEFRTSWILANGWDQDADEDYRLPARADSFSSMAFADELFCNGQVLPLKPPPRLQRSVPTSPKSLSSRIKTRIFVQQCTWNDDFDPFMIALEKVREETGRRMSVHRRSRSYSPFSDRTSSKWDPAQPEVTNLGNNLEAKEPTITELIERKGSMYSRWVRSQTLIKNESPTVPTMMKRLWRGRHVRDANFSQKPSDQPTSLKKGTPETNQKREIMTISRISYFKRLSLSFKTNLRKKEMIESKRVTENHDTKPLRCFGYAPRMKQALRILLVYS